MSRFISSLTALAFAASLGTFAFAASPAPAMKSAASAMHSMGTTMSSKMHSCAKGKTWVKGYTKKNGTKVKGYCR